MSRESDFEMRVENIELKNIKDNPFQPRKKYPVSGIKSLAKSISSRGLLHPISVVKVSGYEHYVIVGGHRRARAFRRLRRKTIPCIIRRQSTRKDLALDLAIENALRKDFSPIEKGHAIVSVLKTIKNVRNDMLRIYSLVSQVKIMNKRGIEKVHSKKGHARGFKDSDIFQCEILLKMLGMSENTALKYLRLLTLPGNIQNKIITISSNESISKRMITQGYITTTMGYEISRINDDKLRLHIYKKAVEERWNSLILRHVIDDILENKKNIDICKLGSSKRRGELDYGLKTLTKRTFSLSSSLWNFRKKLPLIKLTFSKFVFRSSLKKLRKSCLELINRINTLLDETQLRQKIMHINEVEILEVTIRPGTHGSPFRFTFPAKYAKKLELKTGDKLRLKIISRIRKKSQRMIK